MDALNGLEGRKLSAAENMQRLERSVAIADQRIRIRKDVFSKVSLSLATIVGAPLAAYMIYNCFAPSGVMQNMKASSGAYAYFPQNFMHKVRTQRQIYRPEIEYKESYSSLFAYTKRVEEQRAAGTLEEGVHHPTQWH